MADKNKETIQKWAADMFALEAHIEEALDGQVDKFVDHPQAAAAVREFHRMVKTQRESMKAHVESLGGETSSGVKGAVSNLIGKAAGVIDQVRSEAISKMLRDDYTAFNLAAIGYHMLDTTAHALGFPQTSQIAERHLRAYAGAVQKINQIMADVVVWELKKDDHNVKDTMAVSKATDELNQIWRESSPGGATRAAGA